MSKYNVKEDLTLPETVRGHASMASNIQNKVDALGMKRPPSLGADLSDLLYEHRHYRSLLANFLKTNTEDVERMGDILVGMRVWLDHMAWEAGRAIRRMNRVAEFCFEKTEEQSDDSSENDSAEDPSPPETIRANVKMADAIQNKVDALGMRRPPGLGADLSDLFYEQRHISRPLAKFLETDIKDVERMGDILIEMRVWLDHMAWTARRAIPRLNRVIDFCYEKAEKQSGGSPSSRDQPESEG